MEKKLFLRFCEVYVVIFFKQKTKNCYEIEDRQRFSPDFYEGYIQHQQQEGCKYLAFIKGRENFSIVPISDWVLFHKKNKMNEDEFNSKSLKIEEEMIKTTKGELSHKRYLRKQRDEKEDEEDNEEDNKSQKSQKKEKEAVDGNLPPKKLVFKLFIYFHAILKQFLIINVFCVIRTTFYLYKIFFLIYFICNSIYHS